LISVQDIKEINRDMRIEEQRYKVPQQGYEPNDNESIRITQRRIMPIRVVMYKVCVVIKLD